MVMEAKAEELRNEARLAAKVMEQIAEAGRDGQGKPLRRGRRAPVKPGVAALTATTCAATGPTGQPPETPEGVLAATGQEFSEFAKECGRNPVNLLSKKRGASGRRNCRLEDMRKNLKRIPRKSWNAPVLLPIDEFREMRNCVRKTPLSRSRSEPAESREELALAWCRSCAGGCQGCRRARLAQDRAMPGTP